MTVRQAITRQVRSGHTYTFTKYVGIATSSDSRAPHRRAFAASEGEAAARLPPPAPGLRRRLGPALALRRGRLRRPAAPASGAGVVLRAAGQRARATRRGRRRPAASRPTATTATSSGTPRPGCTRACWPPSPPSPGRACSTASTGCGPPGPTPARPAGRERASRGRARCAAPRRRRRSRRPASSRSTSTPTSPWPSTSTGSRPVIDAGWPPEAGRSSRASRATTSAGPRQRSDGTYSIRHVIPPDEYAEGVNDSVYTNMSAREGAWLRLGRRPDAAPRRRPALGAGRTRTADPLRQGQGHPSRVRRVSRRRGEAGRRHPALLPLGARATTLGDPVRSRLLRAAHRPGRPVDDRRDPLDRHLAARHARVCGVHLHPTKR